MIVVSTRPIPPSSSGSRRVDGVEGTPSVVASEDLAGSRVDGVKVVRSVVPTEGGGGAETLLGNSRAQRATSGAFTTPSFLPPRDRIVAPRSEENVRVAVAVHVDRARQPRPVPRRGERVQGPRLRLADAGHIVVGRARLGIPVRVRDAAPAVSLVAVFRAAARRIPRALRIREERAAATGVCLSMAYDTR